MVKTNVESALRNAGIRTDLNSFRLQLPKVIGAITWEALKIRTGKTDIREPLVDAWAIAALWRHFGEEIMHERACTPSWMVPAAHSWVGMSNLLEYINAERLRPFLEPGADLLEGGTDIMAPSIDVFNRVRVHNFPQPEHAAYKLARLGTEQYWNVCKSKLVTMSTAVDALPKE